MRAGWLRFAAIGLFAGAALGCAAAAEDAGPGAVPPCRRVVFEARHYVACSIDVRRFEIAVAWRSADEKPYGSIENYLRQLQPADRPRLAFAMNGGMYEPDLSPVGLLIEHGREQARLNTRQGAGNFYWKPNGVFFAGEGRVGVLEAGRYLKERPRAEFATQSGPVLVTKGVIGRRMLASASSEKIRNGVGVVDENTAVFVISEEQLFRVRPAVPRCAFLLRRALSRRYHFPALRAIGRPHRPGPFGRADCRGVPEASAPAGPMSAAQAARRPN
jgi:uncharacterized protein YigE (DUF2233 family)